MIPFLFISSGYLGPIFIFASFFIVFGTFLFFMFSKTDRPEESHLRFGHLQLELDEPDAAFRAFELAVHIENENPEGYRLRGLTGIKRNKFEAAIADFNEAIRLSPENAGLYLLRGFAYYRAGNFEAAIENYNMANEKDKTLVLAFKYRGLVFLTQQKFESAITDFG